MKFSESAVHLNDIGGVGPEVTARRFLDVWEPMEPQMWMILGRIPTVRSTWRTKRCRPPLPLQENEHKIWEMYKAWMSDGSHPGISFLNFLRTHRTSVNPPSPYKNSVPVAVGVLYVSFYSDVYFGQWLCMNVPHRTGNDLVSAAACYLPPQFVYYASAREKVFGNPMSHSKCFHDVIICLS